MTPELLLSELNKANHHRGGLKCLKLFKVNPDFFKQIQDEVKHLVEHNSPSEVQYKNHVTNWTKPFGRAIQFSLLNTSGKFDDTSTDHKMTLKDKKFHHRSTYPAIAEYVNFFSHAYNMRLNGMGPNGGLSPHEEHIVHRSVDGENYNCRVRFHLPIRTNPKTEMLLDEELFHFEEGYIYFFNNGCVHSATNKGDEFRYHFVWDMLLTQETYDLMFSESEKTGLTFLNRVLGSERLVKPVTAIRIKEYAVQGGDGSKETYQKLRLKKMGIKHADFHKFYNSWNYFKHSKRGKLKLDQVR